MTDLFIEVRAADIDPTAELAAMKSSKTGAINAFFGIVRNEDDDLVALHLQHYEGMTQKQITKIAEQAMNRWSLTGLRVIHRIGRLEPSDMIVMVAASSAHRSEAIEACHFVMDYLKTDAPFWKAEEKKDGVSWVDARESDDSAKDKWQKSS